MATRTPAQNLMYRERMRAQTLAWAQGRPYHEPIEDECCPDFSCCFPDLFNKNVADRWAYYHQNYGGHQ